VTVARRVLLGLALVLVAAYAVFGVRAVRRRVAPAPTAPDELRGVWHVHTTRSDGRGTLADVVHAARAAGAAFVVVTDHDEVTPAEQGWHDGVLVIEGMEASTRFGHVATLGLRRPLDEDERACDPLRAIARLGGRSVLAHPLHPTRPWKGFGRGMPWSGLEVFSNDTAWHQALDEGAWGRIAAGALLLPFDSGRAVLALAAPPLPELARFDAEVQAARGAAASPGEPTAASGRRAPVLLCSADAHGYPSYRAAFRAVTMHVRGPLTGDGERDARAVADALLDGSAVCVLEARGSVARSRFHGGPDAALELDLPADAADATVRAVRDGWVFVERPLPLQAGRSTVALASLCGGPCTPGDYRLELWRSGAPWIFTNPVTIE
jgi:hypothetical protein